jgi:CHAD domain-containing protein
MFSNLKTTKRQSMNKEQIKNITSKHYKKINKQSKIVTEGFDVEAIHQMRVEYKKLRALLRMLSQGSYAEKEIKMSGKLKKTYNIAGSIRDLQLQHQRVQETTKQEPKKPLSYLHLLEKEIDKLKPVLIESFSEKPVADSKKKTDELLPDSFAVADFKKFARQKWSAIHAILISGHFSDGNIHFIRKCLKDLIYNLKVYEGVEYEVLSASIWKGKNHKYFDNLLNELGNFQDQCIGIALLKDGWLNSLKAYNWELLEQVKRKWVKEKINNKQFLLTKLKTDLLLHAAMRKKILSPVM